MQVGVVVAQGGVEPSADGGGGGDGNTEAETGEGFSRRRF
jgi:hypothetical protein